MFEDDDEIIVIDEDAEADTEAAENDGEAEKIEAEHEQTDETESEAGTVEDEKSEGDDKSEKEEEKADEKPEKEDFINTAKDDLSALKKVFPIVEKNGTISEIKNFGTFALMRAKGMSAVEAYIAANGYGDAAEQPVKKEQASIKPEKQDNRAHLQSVVPTKAAKGGISLTKEEEDYAANELFPEKPRKEAIEIYKKSKTI